MKHAVKEKRVRILAGNYEVSWGLPVLTRIVRVTTLEEGLELKQIVLSLPIPVKMAVLALDNKEIRDLLARIPNATMDDMRLLRGANSGRLP